LKLKINILALFYFATIVACAQSPAGDDSDVFAIVEEQAEFPGGIAAMQKYIARTIQYPSVAREAGIGGKCFLKFVVNHEGKIGNVEVLKGVPNCKECDEEAVRVVKMMPEWTPGKVSGKPVNVYYNLPISFKTGGTLSRDPNAEVLSPELQEKHDKAMKYYNEGHKLDQAGKFKEALEKFDISLTHEPNNKYAMFDKAKMLVALGDKAQACEIWNKMVSLQLRKEEAEEFIKKNCN